MHQGNNYHFSRASIELAHFAANYTKEVPIKNVCDLCCGSGVVSIEYLNTLGKKTPVQFIELQKLEFESSLKKNVHLYDLEANYYFGDFINFPTQKFDLILSNPPFYEIGEGRRAANLVKDKCHFFKKGYRKELLRFVERNLSMNGLAFILGPNDLSYDYKENKLELLGEKELAVKSKVSIFKNLNI